MQVLRDDLHNLVTALESLIVELNSTAVGMYPPQTHTAPSSRKSFLHLCLAAKSFSRGNALTASLVPPPSLFISVVY